MPQSGAESGTSKLVINNSNSHQRQEALAPPPGKSSRDDGTYDDGLAAGADGSKSRSNNSHPSQSQSQSPGADGAGSAGGCSQFVLLLREGNLRSFWTLSLMFLAFAASNLCMYILSIVSKEIELDLGFGDGEGAGQEYYYLAGPVFVVIFTIAGIPVGYVADRSNRTALLALSLFFWSLMTLVSGLSTAYWQLLLARIGLAIGEAGCVPYAASIIADHFVQSRSAALSVFNWGLYLGYGLSYAVGNFLVGPLGWRWTFYISSMPGFLLACLIYFSVKEPERGLADRTQPVDGGSGGTAAPTHASNPVAGRDTKVYSLKESLVYFFTARSALILCLAGAVRNSGGYVWSLNTNQFYRAYRDLSPEEVGSWMSWVPTVSGSMGATLGGMVADKMAARYGHSSRLWLLIASQLIAAPLAAGALWLDYPWCFLIQLPANVFSEMWIGVTMAIVVDLFPVRMRAFAIALYFFIIQNIGGNATLLVDPLRFDADLGLRNALLILFPGAYVLSTVFYGLTHVSLEADLRKAQRQSEEETPLLA